MSMSVENVFREVMSSLAEAKRHDTEFDKGRISALQSVADMLARVDECSMEALHEAVESAEASLRG